jgi:hypothetical protein
MRSSRVGCVRCTQENIDRNKQALAALFTGVEIMQEAEESPTAPPRRRPKPDPEVCAHATRLPLLPLSCASSSVLCSPHALLECT